MESPSPIIPVPSFFFGGGGGGGRGGAASPVPQNIDLKSSLISFLLFSAQGTSSQRKGLQSHWESGRYNVIIMSYESCRGDIEWLGPQRWLYTILDEGHIIKNAKTKASGRTPLCSLVPNERLFLLSYAS